MDFCGDQDSVGPVGFMLAPSGFCLPRQPLFRPSRFSSVRFIADVGLTDPRASSMPMHDVSGLWSEIPLSELK